MSSSIILTRISVLPLKRGLKAQNFPASNLTFQFGRVQSISLFSTSSSSSSSDNHDGSNSKAPNYWRKQQLEELRHKFQPGDWPEPNLETMVVVRDDEDLQPMWKNMEGRVKNRRSRTLEQSNGKVGRQNIKKTDEDIWLEEGVYKKYDAEKVK